MIRITSAALLCACLCGIAAAQALPVVNPSFELDTPDGSWNFANPDGAYRYGNLTGWTSNGASGVWRPNLGPNTFSSLPDGVQAGWCSDNGRQGVLSQTIAHAITAGETYTLSVFVGNRTDLTYNYGLTPGAGFAELLSADGTQLATTGLITPTAGTFQLGTATFTATGATAQLGQNLMIELFNQLGTQASFDSVSLTATSVPEPAPMAIVGLGLVAVLRRRRSK